MKPDQVFPTELPPLAKHPIYAEGMAHVDAGRWQQAAESLRLLQGVYPDETELKKLLDEVQMRATMARFQSRRQASRSKPLPVRRLVTGALVIIILIIAAYVAYAVWVQPAILQEMRVRQVASLRSRADEALTAGNYAQARENLQQLQALLPEDPETAEALRRVERMEKLASLYDEAKVLMAAGNWAEAVSVLAELQSLDTAYRDLPELMQTAQAPLALDRRFQAAEASFTGGDWPAAISQYEALQQADLTFRFEEIQDRLFESHLKYGQALVSRADPDRISAALAHFSASLQLRPVDTGALAARRLAETYLAALTTENDDEKITLLQTVYDEQADYAGKTAAQLLYTALLERAAAYQAAGNKADAVTDYQAAARLQVEDPSEARQKLVDLAAQ